MLDDPGRCGAFTAVGGVLPVGRPSERFDDGLEFRPESDEFQGRVKEVGDRAVVGVLRVRVVQRVLPRSLQDPAVLEERDNSAVLGARLVRPFMNLVRVDAQEHEEPDLPGEHARPSGYSDQQCTDQQEVPGALPPGQFSEEARVVVVDDVRPDYQRAEYRGVLGAVGVFQPMKDAGQEISQQDDAEGLEQDQEGVHGVFIAVYFTSTGPRPLIDILDMTYHVGDKGRC